MQGHLRLICERDAGGRSVLREQSFAAPVHVGKSFQEGGCCLLHVVNPTAGLLAGDRVEWDVEVREGARLILSGPSASRAHAMNGGRAFFSQNFRVAAGGWLEANPALFIPQRGARYAQRTRIDLAAGAGLMFLESLAPGRVASGEAFAFDSLEWDTGVQWDGKPILRERYTLSPDSPGVRSLRTLWDPGYYASVVVIHPRLSPTQFPELSGLPTADGVVAGVSALRQGGAIVKFLARTSPALRQAVERLRVTVYQLSGEELPSLRR